MTPTQEAAILTICDAVRDAVDSLGSVPSGHLYARLCGMMSLEQYQMILRILEKANAIEVRGHVLHSKRSMN